MNANVYCDLSRKQVGVGAAAAVAGGSALCMTASSGGCADLMTLRAARSRRNRLVSSHVVAKYGREVIDRVRMALALVTSTQSGKRRAGSRPNSARGDPCGHGLIMALRRA